MKHQIIVRYSNRADRSLPLTLHLRKHSAEVLPTVHEVQSMRFEIAAFQRITAGEEPCEEHTRASLIAAQIMDEIRLQCGLHFPADVD